MEYPEHLKYTKEHEWVAVEEGGRVRVGISDYAQDALGDVVYVELPEQGSAVAAGASCAEIESTKSVSEVYAPVSGTVVDVNAALADAPELVNGEPYGGGWLLVIEMADVAELASLLDAGGYRRMVEEA